MHTRKTGFGEKWVLGILVILCLAVGLGQIVAAAEYGFGDIPLDPKTYQEYLKTWPDRAVEALPVIYDARDDGIVTPAKSQGTCGSCWAFACVGAFESHLLKEFSFGPTDLSEQQQVSCNLGTNGCCGGSSTALRYWEDKGAIYESCFPYGETQTRCPTKRTVPCEDSYVCEQSLSRVTNFHTVARDTGQFKTSLYNDGPSYWRFDVYNDFKPWWNSAGPGSVYVNAPGTYKTAGHAVLIIGWDDNKGAFLCKNSWGAIAGPNGDGTFWIAYSGHYYDLKFGMANFNLTGGPEWDYCFEPSSSHAIYEFNKDGLWLIGYTREGSCGQDNPVIGWVYGENWALARDIPSGIPLCVESEFLWGDMSKNYDWINSEGSTGKGILYPCSTDERELTNDDALIGDKDVLVGGAYCLMDDRGNRYNLTTSGMHIEGTVNHSVCGTCPLIGMVKSGLFSFYVDIPPGFADCMEGYVVAAQVSTLSGVWHNIDNGGTGPIHFEPCAAAMQSEPPRGTVPGAN